MIDRVYYLLGRFFARGMQNHWQSIRINYILLFNNIY